MPARRRLILYSDAPIQGGAERYLLELARDLSRDLFEIKVVVALDQGVDGFFEAFLRAGVAVKRLPRVSRLVQGREFARLCTFFARNRHDILHFNLTDPRSCNGAMTAAVAAFRSRFVVTEHLPGSPFDSGPLPFRQRVAARHTAVTIVNSEPLALAVQARPWNRSRVVIIPNGIPDPGEPGPERRRAARAALGLPPNGPAVGFVGRLIPHKHPELFIEGASRVLPAHPDACFVVLGDGSERAALEARAVELGIGPAIRFLGHRTDAAELVYGLDLLVSTSRYEGMPFAILEAMMAGVPVVAARIEGMQALVEEGVSGALFPPGDSAALGAILDRTLARPGLLATWGQVARERALALFSVEGMCAATARAYDLQEAAGP